MTEETQQTMQEFIAANNITMTAEQVSSRPDSLMDAHFMRHWKCVLGHRFSPTRMKRMTIYFSMGLGLTGPPGVADVLDSIALDVAGVINSRSFEDWCDDYGCDTDSRKAERIYKVCLMMKRKLTKFLNDDELLDKLLWHVERL